MSSNERDPLSSKSADSCESGLLSAKEAPADSSLPPFSATVPLKPGLLPEVSPRAEFDADVNGEGSPERETTLLGTASPLTAVILFLVTFPFFIVVGFSVQKFGHGGLAVLQLLGVATPALIYARVFRLNLREDLNLRRPTLRALAGTVLMGSGTWLILVSTLLELQNLVLPPSEEFLKQREALFVAPEGLHEGLILWLVAALTPSICEELLFRGVLLHSFRTHLRPWIAIVIVSVFFSFFHLNFYQLSITFVLGCLLGWLVVRTGSIVCSVVFHMVNNSMVLLVAQGEDESFDTWLYVLLVSLAVLGLGLILTGPKRGDREPAAVPPDELNGRTA